MNGLIIAFDVVDKAPSKVELTTFRQPYTLIAFGVIAGNPEITRKNTLDGWAEAQGGVFEPVSLWRYARYFHKANEDIAKAIAWECKAPARRSAFRCLYSRQDRSRRA